MTKFRIAGLAALALAATTLATPALASAAPEGSPAPAEFNVSEDLNLFGFKRIDFKCSDYNSGAYPYVAVDTYGKANITYFTGDGTSSGTTPVT